MAVIGSYSMQPHERLDFDTNCTDLVGIDDQVSEVTAVVTPATGLDLNVLINPSKTGVKTWVGPSAPGALSTPGSYKVDLRIKTLLGRTREGELKFKIKEV
jgi:hypothetical protein